MVRQAREKNFYGAQHQHFDEIVETNEKALFEAEAIYGLFRRSAAPFRKGKSSETVERVDAFMENIKMREKSICDTSLISQRFMGCLTLCEMQNLKGEKGSSKD